MVKEAVRLDSERKQSEQVGRSTSASTSIPSGAGAERIYYQGGVWQWTRVQSGSRQAVHPHPSVMCFFCQTTAGSRR